MKLEKSKYSKIKERKKAKIPKLLQKMPLEDMVKAYQDQKINMDMEKKVPPANQDKMVPMAPIKIKERKKAKTPKLPQKMV